MRKLLAVLFAIVVVAGLFAPATIGTAGADANQSEPNCEYPVTLTDATGEEITLEEPPERVVTIAPSDAHTAFEIGAQDRVVGMPISSPTDDLEAGDRTDITKDDGFETDVETVVGLEPDIVLAGNITSAELIDQLRNSGLTVYHFSEAESLEAVQDNVAKTGSLTGACENANETITWMDQRLDILESAIEDEDHPLGYYLMGGGFTAGPGTFQHEALTTAGIENIATSADITGWGMISEEIVVDEDPDWIIRNAGEFQPEIPDSLNDTTAVQEEQFAEVDGNDFSQPAPNVVFAVESLLQTVHPEAYNEIAEDIDELDEQYEAGELVSDGEDADESADTEETDNEEIDNEETDTEESNGDMQSDDDTVADDDNVDGGDDVDESIPGFTAGVAVVGLLVSVGIITRHRQ